MSVTYLTSHLRVKTTKVLVEDMSLFPDSLRSPLWPSGLAGLSSNHSLSSPCVGSTPTTGNA